MGFADFDIMGKCKTIIEKVEEIKTNLSEVKTSASGAKTSADNAKASADTAASNTSVIGATGNTGGSATAGTVMAKLNALITNTAANNTASTTGTLSQKISSAIANTATNNTASKTGILSAKLAYVISLLENTTYGLSALKTASSSSVVKSVQRGVITLERNVSNTATISPVATSKTVVLYTGDTNNSSEEYAKNFRIQLVLTDSTTITASRGSNSGTVTVPYQVIEFY